MLFLAMTIKLALTDKRARLSFSDSIYGHAAIMNAITESNPQAGRKLHDLQMNKPMTAAIVESKPGSAILRLTFITQEGLDYAHLLVNQLSTSASLRLGQVSAQIEQIDLMDQRWGGFATWADLLATNNQRHIYFHFVTPSAIMKRDARGIRYTSLVPSPLDIFSGLARRWQQLEGPSIPTDLDEFMEGGGCVISGQRGLHTTEFKTTERTQLGLVGQVNFEIRWPNETKYAAALLALSQMARFTGIGYQTTRGMGAVRVTLV